MPFSLLTHMVNIDIAVPTLLLGKARAMPLVRVVKKARERALPLLRVVEKARARALPLVRVVEKARALSRVRGRPAMRGGSFRAGHRTARALPLARVVRKARALPRVREN